MADPGWLSRRAVLEVLAENGIRPSRAMGQNFVVDQNTVHRVLRLSGVGSGDQVVEIGAGLGALTFALVASGARVRAVELDGRLARLLATRAAELGIDPTGRDRAAHGGGSLEVLEADATTLDFQELLADRGDPVSTRAAPPWTLVGNLPYSVATSVVLRALELAPQVSSMLVMLQREAGERLAAAPGDAAYGAVSVKVAYFATARQVARVPASVFVPRPKVESVLVRIDRRDEPSVDPRTVDKERLFALVQAGFAHRRKMLRGSLGGELPPEAFTRAGVDPARRAEELSVLDWGRLAGWQTIPEL